MKKQDFIFMILTILVCVFLFIFYKNSGNIGDMATIYLNSKPYKTVSLSMDCEINVNDTNTVVIENGSIYMKNATCPDKLCVKMGKISDDKKDIICLPNKVRIRVHKKSAIDTMN